jgi:hypothetical protein
LCCAYIQQPESKREVAAGMSNDRGDNQPTEIMQELMLAIKMSIEGAHAILGNASKGMTRQIAATLGMPITRGTLKACKLCTFAKMKQKNVNNESEGEKTDKYNGRVYHDIATVKESKNDKSLG